MPFLGARGMVAALFVLPDGPYGHAPDVDVWDVRRDARRYAGPHPVVAHPPCERWGRYWHGGPSAHVRRVKGDDGGCFAAALAAVRAYGGVLEHPADSAAWRAHGLLLPPRDGGWVNADFAGGWTCCVDQGHYGHPAQKSTWLYAVGMPLPSLRWGRARGTRRLDDGCHPGWREAGRGVRRARISARECLETPAAFRDVLLSMAASCRS